jgi:plasmid stability protein
MDCSDFRPYAMRRVGTLWRDLRAVRGKITTTASQNNEARAILTRAFVAGAVNYFVALPSRKSWETAATKAREEAWMRVRPERISS